MYTAHPIADPKKLWHTALAGTHRSLRNVPTTPKGTALELLHAMGTRMYHIGLWRPVPVNGTGSVDGPERDLLNRANKAWHLLWLYGTRYSIWAPQAGGSLYTLRGKQVDYLAAFMQAEEGNLAPLRARVTAVEKAGERVQAAIDSKTSGTADVRRVAGRELAALRGEKIPPQNRREVP